MARPLAPLAGRFTSPHGLVRSSSTVVSEAFPPLPNRIETERLVRRPDELGDVNDVHTYPQDA